MPLIYLVKMKNANIKIEKGNKQRIEKGNKQHFRGYVLLIY